MMVLVLCAMRPETETQPQAAKIPCTSHIENQKYMYMTLVGFVMVLSNVIRIHIQQNASYGRCLMLPPATAVWIFCATVQCSKIVYCGRARLYVPLSCPSSMKDPFVFAPACLGASHAYSLKVAASRIQPAAIRSLICTQRPTIPLRFRAMSL